MRVYKGNLYIIKPADGSVEGMTKQSLLLMAVRAGKTPGKYKMVILALPDNWFIDDAWARFKVEHPIGRCIGSYTHSAGDLSKYTVNKREIISHDYLLADMHLRREYAGNLTTSIINIIK